MTIHAPLSGRCPRWHEDVPPARIAEYTTLVERVHQEILTSASREVVTPDHPRRWHRTLFGRCVPLHYYAGNYRGEENKRPCLRWTWACRSRPDWSFQVHRTASLELTSTNCSRRSGSSSDSWNYGGRSCDPISARCSSPRWSLTSSVASSRSTRSSTAMAEPPDCSGDGLCFGSVYQYSAARIHGRHSRTHS